MSFDEIIDRRGTHSVKWDMMESIYGVSADEGLSMWVADMDFAAPQCIQDAIQNMRDHEVYGYFGDDSKYTAAIQWWMKNRHGWDVQPEWIFTTHGLVNGTAMCVDAFTNEGDAVVLFTPVYHAFARVIKAAGRAVTELELTQTDGKYTLDFDAFEGAMTGRETMMMLCSPHNPSGRVWTHQELTDIAHFAKRHDLIVVSDEIHHDLILSPDVKHIPYQHIAHETDTVARTVMMTATTKTFNIAGSHSGNVIIEDASLRAKFAARMAALGISANSFGLFMATAAYSPEGAKWVDEVCAYIAENARIFDEGINAIPGLKSMPLESTYLAWVDFSGTGMTREEFTKRTQDVAKIAANHGPTFGKGGENFLRFNIACPRSTVHDAVARMQRAFSDLQ